VGQGSVSVPCVPDNIFIYGGYEIPSLAALLRECEEYDEILMSEHFIQEVANDVKIFVAYLNENASTISQQIPRYC
jgi:hypothetical protein